MVILKKNSVAAVAAVLLFSMTGLIPYPEQQQLRFTAYAGGEPCIDYNQTENTIIIMCNSSFLNVVDTVKDQSVLEKLGDDGEYLLNANLQVDYGATLSIGPNDIIKWLKIAGANGIIVNGKILINGIKITSWDEFANDIVEQNINGSIRRAYIQFGASEGTEIINSEFAYLGYNELGRRGFDLFGGGGPSHDMEIRGSEFHHMWRAFYSTGAYNITIDGNEYHDNINYSVDSHSGAHDMNITNNWVHHNRIGVICSVDCYNILIEGNKIDDNANAAIFFSRNMTDSIARNNHIYNSSTGIIVSESPNNQIYDNTIEATTSEGVLLFNPAVLNVPADGLTKGNIVYNNIISNSDDGIRATRSQDNVLEDNEFSNISSSEYLLTENSSMVISRQDFDNTSITEEGSATNNLVEIANSGTIEVVELGNDGDDDREGNYYNTDNAPYRKRLNDGDSIIVNS